MSTITNTAMSAIEIMNQPTSSMKNTDSNKTLTISSDLQDKIQQTQEEAKKGTTDGYQQALYKLNVIA